MATERNGGKLPSLEINGLNFFYPNTELPALNNLNLDIKQGEYVSVIGKSGSGKSTLLRCLKPVLTPHGRLNGGIFWDGVPINEISEYDKAAKIGFVGQNPENQIVTDKVSHELAFGLENLGEPAGKIRLRIAEMACYFGISDWFHSDTYKLSGGQKQILALASVTAMKPEILILDEPCAQLDPIAASNFLSVLRKLRGDMGITIIISEHRLDEVLPDCDRVVMLDGGKITVNNPPREAVSQIFEMKHEMSAAMPVPSRVWNGLGKKTAILPVTVHEGRALLENINLCCNRGDKKIFNKKETAVSAKELWFRYEKNSPDVLRGASLAIYKSEIYSLLGANGTGKSTLLKAFSGAEKPYRGKIKKQGKTVLLPQNPLALFLYGSVREELEETARSLNANNAEKDNAVKACRLEGLYERHPYDLSGGERQRLGLALALLAKPDILLLDEPTKGLDAFYKAQLGEMLKNLCEGTGLTVITASHDIEFCAEYSDRCGLFFDGEIVSENEKREFFSGNAFYTTAANRMRGGFITVGDILNCNCKN